MIQSLIHIGNRRALIIDRAILQAAGLDEDQALFQFSIDPNEGLLIRSVRPSSNHEEAFKQVFNENDALMKRLSQQ